MNRDNDIHVVLTGATQGLGRALARRWVAAGARVVAIARTAADLEALAADAADAPGEVLPVAADVGAQGSAATIAARALEWLDGRVDVLVHDASTLGPLPMPELGDLQDGDLQRVLEVNVIGPWRITQAFVGSMRRQGRGLIVGISSDAAVAAYAGWGAYGASKAALDHMLAIWDQELSGTGVRALSIDPGEMDTAMHAAAIPDADPKTLARPDDVARRILELLAAPPPQSRVIAMQEGV